MFRISILFFILAFAMIVITATEFGSVTIIQGQILITIFLIFAFISFLVTLLTSSKNRISIQQITTNKGSNK